MSDFGIGSIGPNELPVTSQTSQKSAPTDGRISFSQWLHQSLGKVTQLQQQADTATLKLTTGENKDIHNTMIAMQKADIATSLMIEVRNKLISAYDEIKRMQF